jgi:hypothetical protein
MPTNLMTPEDQEREQKQQEAWELSDMISSAGRIVETAIKATDEPSRKALRDAAKTILEQAIARLDESVGASDADDEEDE